MSASTLKLQVGARTLASFPRQLKRVALSLDEALAAVSPMFPMLDPGDDGYLVTSLPDDVPLSWDGLIVERQRYTRWFVNLSAGEAAWRAGLSAQARSGMKRKAKKLAAAGGGALDVRRFRTPEEMAAFHPVARAVAETTYQERLMAAGLPGDAAFVARMKRLSGEDAARGWLLYVGEVPAAYLWCSVQGSALRYDYVGHDPAYAALSPGSVLMAEALRELFADRFARFDFTEGEGQHKRALATGGVACRDLLLLQPTIANRAAVAAVGGFDAAMRVAKRAAAHPALSAVARRVRRA